MPDEAYLASPQSYNYKQPLTSASESYSLATGTALLSPPPASAPQEPQPSGPAGSSWADSDSAWPLIEPLQPSGRCRAAHRRWAVPVKNEGPAELDAASLLVRCLRHFRNPKFKLRPFRLSLRRLYDGLFRCRLTALPGPGWRHLLFLFSPTKSN